LIIKPYMFECALQHPILVEQSRLEISGGCARFLLTKESAQMWTQLHSEDMKDRCKLLQIRQEAIVEIQKREQAREELKKVQIRQGEKDALNEVMKIEAAERERITQEKKEAGQKTVSELIDQYAPEQNNGQPEISEKIVEARQFANALVHRAKGFEDTKRDGSHIFREKPIDLPVRTSTRINVTFTPRIFPTPERESLKVEEEEWLNKQAEHRRAMLKRVVTTEEVSEKEMDPVWLRGKGEAYSNRAACHLKMRNFFKALEDSSTALDLCVPAVPQNLRSRLRAHIRRGAAFCNLKMYKEALVEYKAAHKLDPTDVTIEGDMRNLEQLLNQESTV
ncbi:dyslexia susceptibility 1 candidate protein 1, partial [Paragonimus westermani]